METAYLQNINAAKDPNFYNKSNSCYGFKVSLPGELNPMYGKRGPDSPRWGHKNSKEHIFKLIRSNLGKKRTKETRKKMSEAKKGKPSTFKGKKHSEKSKEKNRESKITSDKGRKYPFHKMKIGDRIVLVGKNDNIRACASSYGKRHSLIFKTYKITKHKTLVIRIN